MGYYIRHTLVSSLEYHGCCFSAYHSRVACSALPECMVKICVDDLI